VKDERRRRGERRSRRRVRRDEEGKRGDI